MFTVKCFIEIPLMYEPAKNKRVHMGEKIANKLKELGYTENIMCCESQKYIYIEDGTYTFIDSVDGLLIEARENFEYIYNCGTNISLFIAVASLRDDSDKWQWFYSTGWTTFNGEHLEDKWVLCDQDTLEHFAFVNNSPNSYGRDIWHKANADELFKKYSHPLDNVICDSLNSGVGIKRKDISYTMKLNGNSIDIEVDGEKIFYIEKTIKGEIFKTVY